MESNAKAWCLCKFVPKKFVREDCTSEEEISSTAEMETVCGEEEGVETRTRQISLTSSQMLSHGGLRDENEVENSATLKKLLTFLFCLVAFMAISAVVFNFFESDNERKQMVLWKKVEGDIRRELNLTDIELVRLLQRLEGVKKYGLAATTKWDFYNSFWFTMTITTTIGFGHITPVTSGGRLFCILCGLLGIPLNALVLKYVGNKIRLRVTKAISVLETRCLGRQKCKHVEIKCACVSFLLMIIVILLGGCLDLMFDGWTFTDGIYFNFIALSTIGFGDIYPSVSRPSKLDNLGLGPTEKRLLASAIMAVYLTLGLAIVSSVVVSILTAMESVDKAKKRFVSWRKRGTMNFAFGSKWGGMRGRHHRDCRNVDDSFHERYRKDFGFSQGKEEKVGCSHQ